MGTKERRKREKEEREALILLKARELFFERGFNNVSIQDICEAVEYGKSVIYSHFETKEEIYGYIYVEAMQIMAGMMKEVNSDSDDPDWEFLRCVDVFFRFYRDYRPYYKAMFYFDTNSMAYSKIPDRVKEKKMAEAKKALAPMERLLENGIKSGFFEPMDVKETIMLLTGSMVGIISGFIHRGMEDNLKVIRKFLLRHGEIYLDGLKSQEAERKRKGGKNPYVIPFNAQKR